MTVTKLLSTLTIALSIFSSTAFSMQDDFLSLEKPSFSSTVIHIKEDVDEKTPIVKNIIKKESKKRESCKDCDIEYWGFTQLLMIGANYLELRGGRICDDSDGGDVCCKIICCPLATAGWLACLPFSCIACCCCCPKWVDEFVKEAEIKKEREEKWKRDNEISTNRIRHEFQEIERNKQKERDTREKLNPSLKEKREQEERKEVEKRENKFLHRDCDNHLCLIDNDGWNCPKY